MWSEGSWAAQAVATAAHGVDVGAILTVAPDTPWRQADDRARELGVRHLFVVDGSKLVGVLCRCDLYPEPEP
ncbi:MAG: CBS domain-containing protein, partial [Polyangia bacterium]